jgi:hypothetical protein
LTGEQLPAEKNSVTTGFRKMGIKLDYALHTQAALQLKKNYCDVKRCLECAIGHKIFNPEEI